MEKSRKLTPGYITKVFKQTELAFINLGKALNKLDKNGKVKNPQNEIPQQGYGKQATKRCN